MGFDVYNHPDVAACEMPSNNMHASARALATVASAMACGGAHRGVRLLSEAGVDAAHAEDVRVEARLACGEPDQRARVRLRPSLNGLKQLLESGPRRAGRRLLLLLSGKVGRVDVRAWLEYGPRTGR